MLDTFKTEWTLDTLNKASRAVAVNTMSFDAVPSQEAMLGKDKDVPVKLMQLEGSMSGLHRRLMKLVDGGTFVFNTPEFVGDGFLPHATDQENDQIEVGKVYSLGSISLIDMFPDNNHMRREVLDTYNFMG